MKVCTKCKVEKDEALFSKNRSKCKDCWKEYNAGWRAENKDNVRKQIAKYYLENKDKIKEINVKWRAENKDKLRKNAAKWKAENKTKYYEYHAKYRENLADGYVAGRIIQGTILKAKDIPIELIEAKRMQIMIHRKIKEMTK